MATITVGQVGRKKAEIDLDVLLRTRLLVEANSGGGKSWLLRRLAEQMFGKVQVLLIDPEGEFATLREKYGFVLVGKGGETPADVRSAGLVATKLLELRASAVLDLYEMKVSERHRYVRLFLDTLIDAPKKLWHPVVVIVDEAHVYCPEKGAAESEASDAMIGLATRGRKRGFCAVWATQRLGKLRKDGAAELLNIMVGPTFMDIDRKRAAEALGVPRSDQAKFFDSLKLLEPGEFYALGRAISKDQVLVSVGSVATTHPECGSAKHGAEPPPTPDQVRRLLPKLGDLPREAEEKAQTEASLRAEIRSLKASLQEAQRKPPSVARNSHDDKEQQRLRHELIRREREWRETAESLLGERDNALKAIHRAAEMLEYAPRRLTEIKAPKPELLGSGKLAETGECVFKPRPAAIPQRPQASTPTARSSEDGLSPKQMRMLDALAEFRALGVNDVTRTWVAALTPCSHRSSAFTNNLGALRSRGYIEYGSSTVRLTEKGQAAATMVTVPVSPEGRLDRCLRILRNGKQRAILTELFAAYPNVMSRSDIAQRAECSITSSAFTNNLGALRSGGMIEYVDKEGLRCAGWLFFRA